MSSVTGTGLTAAMSASDPWFDGRDFADHWAACGLRRNGDLHPDMKG